MAKLYDFKVITPTRVFYSDQVESVVFETEEGQMGVMADHVPMLVANKDCTLKIVKGKDVKYAFITEGFIEIAGKNATMIVDEAEWQDEIDVEAAMKKKKKAEDELMDKRADLSKKAQLKASIERSNARIRTGKMFK